MRWLFRSRKWKIPDLLFSGHYADSKVMYVQLFNEIPNIGFIGELDMTKAFELVKDRCSTDVIKLFQHTYYDYDAGSMIFNNTLFVLSYDRIVELASGYCQVLYSRGQYTWATGLIKELAVCRVAPEPVKETRIIGFTRHKDLI